MTDKLGVRDSGGKVEKRGRPYTTVCFLPIELTDGNGLIIFIYIQMLHGPQHGAVYGGFVQSPPSYAPSNPSVRDSGGNDNPVGEF